MLKHILLLVTVVACHPDGGEAQHPEPPAQHVEARYPEPPAQQAEAKSRRRAELPDDLRIHASYFKRLKLQVARAWDPTPVWRRADPTGTRYGSKTRITELRVSLSPQGELAKILVVSPSGANELDEEAVRAFRIAAPFPNPPAGLLQKDNLFTFGFSLFFNPALKTPQPASSSPPSSSPPQTPPPAGPQ